jgi:hypothetical protein
LPQNNKRFEDPNLNKQERGKELATLVVSSLRDTLVFLILLERFVRSHKSIAFMGKSVAGLSCCKQQLQASPHALSSQNQNTSATQMRGFKDYYLISLLRRFATRNNSNLDSPFTRMAQGYIFSVIAKKKHSG